MLQMIFFSKILFIQEVWKEENVSEFTQKYLATIFNIGNNKKCFLSTKPAY